MRVLRTRTRKSQLLYQMFDDMVKKTKATSVKKESRQYTDAEREASVHHFQADEEVEAVRSRLLGWYDENKRDLPWRRQADNKDANQRGYAVWVSEIMLQQTQVATVIDYYNRWMKKWPTLQDLAKATLEEVNEMWSGLGYYSRGRRLHEGAQKVVSELAGQMPTQAEELISSLPGVGKYTAGAISSIAYQQVTGLVDGNVIRVVARMRGIGVDSTGQAATQAFWDAANKLVDPERPGDFNQAMMELGATICTPKTPSCTTCPVQKHCFAQRQVEKQKRLSATKLGKSVKDVKDEIVDIECLMDACELCLPADQPWDPSIGVLNYPRKAKKAAARTERTAVCILETQDQDEAKYLIVQRPKTGLLAGLWEFPSLKIEDGWTEKATHKRMDSFLEESFDVEQENYTRENIGEVVHLFSHIHQTYVIQAGKVEAVLPPGGSSTQPSKWVTKEEFLQSAISTAMKKVFKAFEASQGKQKDSKTKSSKRKRNSSEDTGDQKKQLTLNSFFKPKTK